MPSCLSRTHPANKPNVNLPLYIARKFYGGYGDQTSRPRASAPAVRIATIGVALGLAVMIVSVGIVRGFKQEINRKLYGFSAHAQVVDIRSFVQPDQYGIAVDSSFISRITQLQGVERVQRFAEKMGVLKTEEEFEAILLRGIAPEYDTHFLEESIVDGALPNYADSASNNQIVISQTHASALHLAVGDKVYAYFFEETVKMRRFTIAAIYQTNVKQYDQHMAVVPMSVVQRLNEWEPNTVSGVEMYSDQKLPMTDWTELLTEQAEPLLAENLTEQKMVVGLNENPRTMQVVSWLSLLDMNIWLILVLVALVAVFSMSAGLLILILERTSDIGLLCAIGMSTRHIRTSFLYYAAFIVVRGLIWGNLIGCSLLWVQQRFGLVQLDPATYYVRVLPVDMNVWLILLLNLATFAVTLLALIIPSLLVERIQPARAIRFD